MLTEDERARKELFDAYNAEAGDRMALEERHGQVWDSDQMQEEFIVKGFAAPAVMVMRKSDKIQGFLMFQHAPRFYWGFKPLGK